ncbi:MAG: transglycosylase domain-containing protein, partial [Elusimicrobia bacterium]|nr:transglycosylase domain-containing protein [Elusimicrobiota bacterium]
MEKLTDFLSKIKKTIYIWLFILFSIIASFYIGKIAYDLGSLPSITALEDYTPSLATKIYDFKGELITELYAEKRTLTPIHEIPDNLRNAFLAIEDINFYKHWGISPKGILRATINNLIHRKVAQGGSTITQQLAKTIFLTPERTFLRKIKELIITLQLEHYYSKDEILQLYLNQIYLGSGAYGVEFAAKIYFSKHAKDLNLAECAMLAGLPRAPNYYSPFNNLERALNRRAVVLKRMKNMGFITEQQEIEANAEIINIEKSEIPTAKASYFVEYVRTTLEPIYGTDMIYRGGLSIYTTLDINAQMAAEKAIEESLSAFDIEREPYLIALSTPSVMAGTTTVKVQGALIAIDPKTGGIRAMVGGRDFKKSQFN